MAIYLPELHLALDLVDDPCNAPAELDAFPDMTVIRLTCADLMAHVSGTRNGAARRGGGTLRPAATRCPAFWDRIHGLLISSNPTLVAQDPADGHGKRRRDASGNAGGCG